MKCRTYCILSVFVSIFVTDAVKVDMQGSITLGKDVMDTLRYLMRRNVDGRRSMSVSKGTGHIQTLLADIGRGIRFCDNKLETFLIDYVMILTRAIEGIFEAILNVNGQIEDNQLVFEDEFRTCIDEIKNLLKEADDSITDDNKVFVWISLIKNISSMFQEMSINFVKERLESSPREIDQAKNKLIQKLIIATVMVEGKFEIKLCSDHQICTRSNECTTALNTLLQTFQDKDDETGKLFIRSFYSVLPDTKFFSILSEVTGNEFQVILNDMAYTDSVPTKKVLLTVQKTIQARIDSILSKKHKISGRDVDLLYSILSDMDHIYRKNNANELHVFLKQYFQWLQTGRSLNFYIRQLMKEIKHRILNETPEVLRKLTREVQVFMEITVVPEA